MGVFVERIEGELARLSQLVEGRGREAAAPPFEEAPLGAKHPLASLAGRLRDHPLWDAWSEAVEEQRRQLDEAEGIP